MGDGERETWGKVDRLQVGRSEVVVVWTAWEQDGNLVSDVQLALVRFNLWILSGMSLCEA